MKIAIGLLLVCLLCLIAVPVGASSFGLSPAIISIQFHRGNSSTFYFTVSSYSGLVEISSEGMPVTVTPSSVNVIAGSPIAVIVGCNSDAISGIYDGRIKFLAKSGGNVLAGINVICNLTVLGLSENITLTTNVVGNDGGGGGWIPPSSGSVPYTPPDWASMFPSMNEQPPPVLIDDRPVQINPTIYIPPVVGESSIILSDTTTLVTTPVQPSSEMSKAVWAGIVFWAIIIGLGVWGLSWIADKRRKKVQ